MSPKLCLALALIFFSATVSCRPLESYYQVGAGLPSFEEMYSYYESWLAAHGNYRTKDSHERFEAFSDRVLRIISHNQDAGRTYDKAVNKFTGKLDGELKSSVMEPQNCTLDSLPIMNSTGVAGTSDFLDWRDNHKIAEIKNQRDCGGSWAFAAVCAVEAHWAIRTEVTPIFSSEQQLLDCASAFQTQGCSGGLPQQGFSYIQYSKGLNSENGYPFEALPSSCRTNDLNVVAKVFNGSINITAGDETGIFNATRDIGPVAVGFDATEDLFAYDGGVYTSTECRNDTKIINHAFAVVGYGYDAIKDLDYWIAKNSWGPDWGEEGYIRIARGANVCGIANCASVPNLNYTSTSTTKLTH